MRGFGKQLAKGMDAPEVQKGAADAGDKAGGKFSGSMGRALKAGIAALGIAGIGAGMAKAFSDGLEREKLGDKTAAALGLTEKQSQAAGKVAGKLYAGAYGESMGDVSSAVENVLSSIEGMSSASPKELESVSAAALDIAAAFDVDVSQAATNAGILMKTGLAPDATAAMDLITASLQKVPASLRGEVMDATQEYSDSFAALGLTGEESMGLLTTASENGQYGIDKMGDAIKEFTIRGTDMSKSTVAAYEAIGLNSEETTNDLLAGGDRASGAFQKIVEGVQGIKDPAEQSQAALALFGTPLEDLGTKDIPKFLDSLTSADTGLGDVEGAAKSMGDTLNDNLGTRMEGWKRSIQTFASDGVMALVDGFESGKGSGDGFMGVVSNVGAAAKGAVTWVRENKDVVQGLAVAVLAAVAAYKAYRIAMAITGAIKAFTLATQGATVAQRVLNLVMRSNPIGILVTAISGLVAGLVYFFTKTETGKKIVAAAWAGIKIAIKAVADWWTKTAWPAIQRVINAFKAGFQTAGRVIGNVWAGIKSAISAVWAWIDKWVFTPIKLGLKLVGAGFTAYKDLAVGAWDKVKGALSAGWKWISQHVFTPFKAGVAKIGDAFSNVQKAIKTTWDKLKEIAAKPVNFILGTVYNDGIREWWNKIAGAVGLTSLKLPRASEVKFASGGVMPGYTPGRDVHNFVSPTGGRLALSGGEAIMRPEWTRAVGGPSAVAAMNSAAKRGQAFADGGVWGWVKNTAGDTWDGIKNVGKGIWDAGAMAVEILKDPIGSIKKALVDGIIKPALANSGAAGDFVKIVGELPGKFAGGLASKVKAMLGAQAAEDASGPGSWSGAGLGVARMSQIIQGLVPGTRITSGFRPGAIAAGTGKASSHASGRAIDMAGPNMGVIFDAVKRAYPNSKEIIYSPKGGQQVYKGKPFNYPEPTRSGHFNHVHWGYKNGGVFGGAGLYDQGGWIPNGGMAVNLSGKPEAVLTPDESQALKSGIGEGPLVNQLIVRDEQTAVRELESLRRRRMTQARLGAGR